METGVTSVIKDGKGNAIIYTALIAAALANAVPTPFDAIYFNRQRVLKERLENGEISIKRYWYQDIGEYYLWTALWYGSLLAVVAAIGGSFKTNARVLLAFSGAGLVVGVLLKNIQKDKELLELKKQHGIAVLP
jgi:hypothetical protein